MSTQDERILIHRLAAGELDALEAERAHALLERDPELAELLALLDDLQSQVRGAFPEPPPLGDRRAFVEAMGRLTATASEAADPYRESYTASTRLGRSRSGLLARRASAPRSVPSRAAESARFDVTSTLGTEPSSEAHLFHLREIRREESLPVELEFYAGDVLALQSEVLLVSAFAGSYQPTPGSVFGAIAERYGISFAARLPSGAVRYPEGLLHFEGVSCPAFDSLWVIEMREPDQRFSAEDLREALRAIGARLPDMLADAASITLPLLGAGQQRLAARDVARELLSAIPEWARNPRLRTIRVVTLELEHVALLNRALDDRDFSVVENSGFRMACEELRRQIERGIRSQPIAVALKDLLQIASAPDPSLQSIALEGRRIAEIALRALPSEDADQPGRAALPDTGAGQRAELMASQLQLLLAHGRSAAAGERVASNDAVMILYTAMGVAEVVSG